MLEELDPYEFVLAERLGMTLAELSDRMTTREFAAWQAFDVYRIEMQKLNKGKR